MTKHSLDQILKILNDGQWHNMNEITKITRLSALKMRLVTDFLAKYNFVELDRANKKLKLSCSLVEFCQKISLLENEKS